ncbi:TIGR03013 family XrtA/PEP-CTERM system glycosyltransferase [Propionivibrio limicola]|uniref:TIGR03013 family XrtA/PEP-CTERM system glycosyltransferase n=1 Tax=Propionivibrio limicola TaxID=167645 RepID=UPI001291D020|nr:TIGR03013 family XrtA/PEP-CTERM system glycosyltransferase [Propionivibrio limicola]
MIRVFSHWVYWKTILRMVFDLVFTVVCVISPVLLWGQSEKVEVENLVVFAVAFALAMVLFNAWLGLYNRRRGSSAEQIRSRAVLSLYLSIPFAYGVFSLLSNADDNQRILVLSALFALFLTLLHRAYSLRRHNAKALTRRVLVFGAGKEASQVGDVLLDTDPDIEIVGFYPTPNDAGMTIPGQRILPREKPLSDTVAALNVDEIIVAVLERRGGVMPLRELLDCKMSGVRVLDLASYFERALGQIRLDSLKAGWLIFGDGFRQGWGRTLIKRVFDIVAASILLLLATPVMLLTTLLIILEDGFPVFYRQERVGRNGRTFNVIKFRSMRKDAESDGTPKWAAANDNRVTRVGRIIRRLRIDELPQLFTVLAGDMSLVGPRPERPYFVDRLTREIPFYAVRHSVKPGVTGWAQVSYHYGASVDDSLQKLQYDLYYVKNHTLFLDIVILFETVGVVLTGKGAQ